MAHRRLVLDIENKALVLDLVEWIAHRPRTYTEVMEAWRTSCPRLSIWEDAVSYGLVACQRSPGKAMSVNMTAAGRAFLTAEGRDSQR